MSGAVVGGWAGVPGDGGVSGRGALQSQFHRIRQPAGHGAERAQKSRSSSAETKLSGNNLRNNIEYFVTDVFPKPRIDFNILNCIILFINTN